MHAREKYEIGQNHAKVILISNRDHIIISVVHNLVSERQIRCLSLLLMRQLS